MDRAAKLIRYFLSHIRKTYAIMGRDQKVERAGRLWKWICREGRSSFTRREAFRAMRGQGFRETGDVDPVLTLLEKFGHIRPLAHAAETKQGRKPSPAYEVNPLACDHGHNGHNGHNSPDGGLSVHSVQSVHD
jgi:replicative DNA helicase